MSAKHETVVEYADETQGLVRRTFSHDIHGEDHADIAKQFAKKYNGRILKDGDDEDVDPEKPAKKGKKS